MMIILFLTLHINFLLNYLTSTTSMAQVVNQIKYNGFPCTVRIELEIISCNPTALIFLLFAAHSGSRMHDTR